MRSRGEEEVDLRANHVARSLAPKLVDAARSSVARALAAIAGFAACGNALAQAPGGASKPNAPDGPAREMGTFGALPAPIGAVIRGDALVHQDVDGGAAQELQALAGAPGGGFAAVWRDVRDGMLGLYLVRLTPEGEAREPERPIHAPHSGRRRDPAVALAPDASGAVVWTSVFGGRHTVFLRTFDSTGEFTCDDVPLEPPAQVVERAVRADARDTRELRPDVAISGDGSVAVAWIDRGVLVGQRFDRRGAPTAPAFVVHRPARTDRRDDLGEFRVVGLASDAVVYWSEPLAGWTCGRSFGAAPSDRPDPPLGQHVLGTLGAVSSDARGAVALVTLGKETRDARTIMRADATGLRFAPTAVDASWSSEIGRVALALGDAGALVAYARKVGDAGELSSSRLAFATTDPPATPTDLPSDFLGSGSSAVLVAASGPRFLIAWTAFERGDGDVAARTLEIGPGSEPRWGSVRKLNTDVASSDQSRGRVSAAGERAIVAWQDARSGYARLFVRRMTRDGFAGDEVELPIVAGDRPRAARMMPEIALRTDGSFAAVWRESTGDAESVHAQVLAPDTQPMAPPVALDPGQSTFGVAAPALVALPGTRGFVAAWSRPKSGGLWAAVIDDQGGASSPFALAANVDAQSPSLALLDDGRVLCAWDERTGGEKRGLRRYALRAHFLDSDGRPEGATLSFEPSVFGADWDPCVAPGPPGSNGGFVLAWTAGAPDDLGRDVWARAFDRDGQPAGPFLPLSTISNEQDWPSIARLADGSWVAAWEDDLSGYDHIHARRILPGARSLGPTVLVEDPLSRSVPDRVLPSVSAWGDGFIATWGHRRRSLGWDVDVKVLGAGWDGSAGR